MTSKLETEQQKVKPKVDLWPRWELEQKCYTDAKIRDVKTGKWESWPRLQSTEEIVWNRFIEKITDPETGDFNPKRDEEGKPVKTTPNNIPKYAVVSIIRYRKRDNTEWLLSKGNFIGYDALGDELKQYVPKPQVWSKTNFQYVKDWDPKRKSIVKNCLGPSQVEDVYTMPFNEKNLKELFDKRQDDNIQFAVKDENASAKAVSGVNIQETYKIFLKSSFSYLFNADYITPEMKHQYRQEAIDAGLLNSPAAATTTRISTSPPSTGTYL